MGRPWTALWFGRDGGQVLYRKALEYISHTLCIIIFNPLSMKKTQLFFDLLFGTLTLICTLLIHVVGGTQALVLVVKRGERTRLQRRGT